MRTDKFSAKTNKKQNYFDISFSIIQLPMSKTKKRYDSVIYRDKTVIFHLIFVIFISQKSVNKIRKLTPHVSKTQKIGNCAVFER